MATLIEFNLRFTGAVNSARFGGGIRQQVNHRSNLGVSMSRKI
jgi:hypothetical protein